MQALSQSRCGKRTAWLLDLTAAVLRNANRKPMFRMAVWSYGNEKLKSEMRVLRLLAIENRVRLVFKVFK